MAAIVTKKKSTQLLSLAARVLCYSSVELFSGAAVILTRAKGIRMVNCVIK